jgi:hypothetical protein
MQPIYWSGNPLIVLGKGAGAVAVEKVAEAHDPMGWLEFVAAMTGSLAWPVAAIVIACVFRSQISSLLAKIRKLTWGDKSADFADKLDKIEAATLAVEPPPPTTQDHIDAIANSDDWKRDPLFSILDERYQSLVAVSPEAAILDAWKPVERKIRDIAKDRGEAIIAVAGSKVPNTTHALLRSFVKIGIIGEATYHNLNAMLKLRNEAVHLDNVTAVDAIRFYDLTQQALHDLSFFDKKPPATDR